MDSGFAKRTVLVTGASGGIGQSIVRALAAEGANVVVHCLRNLAQAEKIAAPLGARGMTVAADLTSETDVQQLFRSAVDHFGAIHTVIANAGVWPAQPAPVHRMSLQQWNTTVAADLSSVFLCMREFFRHIISARHQDPSAVLIGSTAGVFGEAGHADYAACKSGLIHGLMLSLKNELVQIAPRGRVNCVCPGWTMTPMTEKFSGNAEAIDRALATIAMNKFATPEDIASAVVFLASPTLAGHITGQYLVVSGGMEGRVLNPHAGG